MIEAEQKRHFNVSPGCLKMYSPTGENLARKRLLAAHGYAVISVPIYVWNELLEEEKNLELIKVIFWLCMSNEACRTFLPTGNQSFHVDYRKSDVVSLFIGQAATSNGCH